MKKYNSPEIVTLGTVMALTEGSSEPVVDHLGPPLYHNAAAATVRKKKTVVSKKKTAVKPVKKAAPRTKK